jgi:hypothetical protein
LLESSVTATPEPPPEGWTLPEAAAALFPDAWSAVWFPDDATSARAVPGIRPTPSPWSQVPLDMIDTVAVAVLAGGEIPAGLETVVVACRAHEAETAQRIATALVRRAEQRAALPGLLAARLASGAFMARGVSPRDPLRPVDIPALAWGAAEIALGWEGATVRRGSKPYSTHSSPPPAPGSVTLPGGITLRGVRVFAASPRVASPTEPQVQQPADEPADGVEVYRTGVPGRPTSKQLVEQEHARRLAEGKAHVTLADEARHLAAWLVQRHPHAPSLTAGSVENSVRRAHRRAMKSPTE